MSGEWSVVKRTKKKQKKPIGATPVFSGASAWDGLEEDDPDQARAREQDAQRKAAADAKSAKVNSQRCQAECLTRCDEQHKAWVRKDGRAKKPGQKPAKREPLITLGAKLGEQQAAEWLAQARSVMDLGEDAVLGTLHAAVEDFFLPSQVIWRQSFCSLTPYRAVSERARGVLLKGCRSLGSDTLSKLLEDCAGTLLEAFSTDNDTLPQLSCCTGAGFMTELILTLRPSILSIATVHALTLRNPGSFQTSKVHFAMQNLSAKSVLQAKLREGGWSLFLFLMHVMASSHPHHATELLAAGLLPLALESEKPSPGA